MKLVTAGLLALVAMRAGAQVSTPPSDPWQPLSFLQGTWEARTGSGSAAQVAGDYTFRRELKGHVLARRANVATCDGPDDFDCQHADALYVYQDAPETGFKAIYLDNEGHVIHYVLSFPDPTTVVFLSDPGLVPGSGLSITWKAV